MSDDETDITIGEFPTISTRPVSDGNGTETIILSLLPKDVVSIEFTFMLYEDEEPCV